MPGVADGPLPQVMLPGMVTRTQAGSAAAYFTEARRRDKRDFLRSALPE